MALEPIYLDLDEIAAPVDFTVKLNGKEHKVVETSVEDFIKTAKQIEKLGIGASVTQELELSLSIIGRTLPSIPQDELRGLKLTQLQKIRDFVMTANGEKVEEVKPAAVTGSTEGAEGNAPATN